MKTKYLFLLSSLFIINTLFAQKIVNGAEQMETLLPLLNNKRVALVVNQTSMTGNTHLLDTLLASNINIKKVFAPEHGFRGNADAGETVKNGKDISTGIPIQSLYGKNKKPTPQQMQDIDVVVFDIQDVGARFYTYISTMHYVMEACAENHKELIITDRPNPCDYTDGPVRIKGLKSFVSMHPIPVLHGCTVGELAQMINGEGWLAGKRKCKLTVIPVKGWKHGDSYSLPVKPSPNLPNDQAIALYPSLCPFEGTVVSLGRGTDRPFEVYGHPDMRGREFSFTPRPTDGAKHPPLEGRVCRGVDLSGMPLGEARGVGFSLRYVIDAYRDLGLGDRFFTPMFEKLVGAGWVRGMIVAGASEEAIRARWVPDVERYREKRVQYLLYE